MRAPDFLDFRSCFEYFCLRLLLSHPVFYFPHRVNGGVFVLCNLKALSFIGGRKDAGTKL